MSEHPSIAVVIDAMPEYAGAEHVLAAVLELYPDVPIYTLVYNPQAFVGTSIESHPVHTSWLQHMPGGRVHYRKFLPLLPLTFQMFDLHEYDIVLSFSYAVAHGAACHPDQLHISYTFAPLRYAWQNANDYFRHGLIAPLARIIFHYFRQWDQNVAARVNHFVAISEWTAKCIGHAYHREAEVIYPPIEIEHFKPLCPRGDHFVALSRLVDHKRIELIVRAFSRLGLPLVVIGEGPERKKLEALAAPNVKLLGWQSDEKVRDLLGRARALVHAAEEDFGLVLVEAQAAGCPVIALGRGAASEIILEAETGLLFQEPTVEALIRTVQAFERNEKSFRQDVILANAHRFRRERFQEQFARMVAREWSSFSATRQNLTRADRTI
jgi:glycosyltransferase involved in cell wall biosynthesis